MILVLLAPLSPGLIDRHHSSFHPERLYLKWAVPVNNTRVDSYSISISDQHSSFSFSSSSNNLEITSKRFQPGTNYTVTLYAISYGYSGSRHTEDIETLREYIALVLICTMFIPHSMGYGLCYYCIYTIAWIYYVALLVFLKLFQPVYTHRYTLCNN